jgi:hypothetical protein
MKAERREPPGIDDTVRLSCRAMKRFRRTGGLASFRFNNPKTEHRKLNTEH